MVKPTAEILSALSNLATVLAVALGFWAFFFTSIPDDVARQFRTEISDLNEQLVDLRQQRRMIDDQNTTAKQELITAQQDLAAAKNDLQKRVAAADLELAQMNSDLESAEKSLKAIGADRQKYLAELVRYKFDLAVSRILTSAEGIFRPSSGLGHFRFEASQTSTIIEYRRWAEEAAALGHPSPENIQVWYDHINQLEARSLTYWMIENQNASNIDEDELKAYRTFRSRITGAEREQTLCRDLLADAVMSVDYETIGGADQQTIKDALGAYMKSRKSVLSYGLVTLVSPNASDEEIEAAGKATLAKIDSCAKTLKQLPSAVADNVGARSLQ